MIGSFLAEWWHVLLLFVVGCFFGMVWVRDAIESFVQRIEDRALRGVQEELNETRDQISEVRSELIKRIENQITFFAETIGIYNMKGDVRALKAHINQISAEMGKDSPFDRTGEENN